MEAGLARFRLWCVGVLAFGSAACASFDPDRWALVGVPDDARCLVPINEGDRRVEVTESSRQACVAMADIIERQLPDLTEDALRAGPPSSRSFRSDEDVHCRLIPRPEGGGSLKFRCMRTDPQNRLYDDEEELVPQAVTFDDDGVLLDGNGAPILKESGKPREGDELRVKYFVGAEPDARYREMFTETVVSQLFWAIGIPADRVYMPSSVRCFGCSPNPFGQARPDSASAPQMFRLASVERRYEGKRINVGRRRGWLGLGGSYGHGFGFGELENLAGSGDKDRRIATEVLATALNIVGYNNLHAYQNEMVCRKDKWDKDTGVCEESVAYVQDVGGTLGGRRARALPGVRKSGMTNYPRGDWPTFSQEGVFGDAARCRLFYEIAGVDELSEDGRLAFDKRIRGRVGMEELLVIFEKANIHRMDSRVTELVATQSGLPPGRELDRRVQRLWAEEIDRRLREVQQASCSR